MIRGLETILIGTEDAKKLAAFYKEKIGLKVGNEMINDETKEEFYIFSFGSGPSLCILDHSEVKGKSQEPQRVFFNLEVDEIEGEVKRLKDAGVKLVTEIYHVPDYGLIATFEDPDGNYFQLVQVRPS